MLSIIVCSKYNVLAQEFIDNISDTVGVDYEIIHIDNSESQYSIFSAYNLGFAKSEYQYLCFVHEDVKFYTQNWGQKMIDHLDKPKSGILGLAGTDLVTRIPGSCSGRKSNVNIIQSDKTGKKASRKILFPENFTGLRRSAIVLDGVILSLRRDLMEQLEFDEQIGGFHGYDYDICLQAFMKGYTNYVIYDIELEHFSRGKFDEKFYRNLITVFKKWENFLPLIGPSVTEEKLGQIQAIEEQRLFKLTKKMIRFGFSGKEIVKETTHYTNMIKSPKAITRLRYIRPQIFIKRLLSHPQYLFK